MSGWLAQADSMALRHMLKDAQRLLEGGSLGERRRTFVLTRLAGAFNEAQKGSELAQASGLFFCTDDTSAFSSFTALEKYLGHVREWEWPTEVRLTADVFLRLESNETVSSEDITIAGNVLQKLLKGVHVEETYGRQLAPSTFELS